MSRRSLSHPRSRRVPEVLQSSLTDCGPAALKAVLEGFGISVGYDELRERCQTDVDGTSIDALATLGRAHGLSSQQILVPHDHFLLPEARCLPAIVVTRSGGGLLHFVVVWRSFAGWVEVLDPGSGRRWTAARRLLAEMPTLPLPISAARFRRWAASEDAARPWRARLRQLGVSAAPSRELMDLARLDPTWIGFARFDAAVRMASTLVRGGAVRRGREVERVLGRLLSSDGGVGIPERFRWVRPSAESSEQLVAHGSVILRFSREPAGSNVERASAPAQPRGRVAVSPPARKPETEQSLRASSLPAAVVEELTASRLRPLYALWILLWARAGKSLGWLIGASLLSAALVPGEALVLRALLDIDRHLALGYQLLAWLLGMLALVGAALWLDCWTASFAARLGRELETRVRVALLERLPRLADHYLRSRSSSDMASRGHSLFALRTLPGSWAQLARSAATVVALTGTLAWLYPEGLRITLALALSALLLPFLGRRALGETSLRLHTQAAALDRFYLDTLLGASPVRVHGAERAIQNAHEQLLTEWAATARRLHRGHTVVQGVQLFGTTACAVGLVLWYLTHAGESTRLLLLAYLALRLPASGNELTSAELALRSLGSVALRALAPLAVPRAPLVGSAEPEGDGSPRAVTSPSAPAQGVQLSFRAVTAIAGGHTLLTGIDLDVAPGQHVGVVGASGAGKSSLIGVLLGWLAVSEGSVRVDGQPLDAARLRALYDQTAWVDPAIQLWELSLFDNLAYGADDHPEELLPQALSRADLLDVLARLPDGLASNLGEGGALLSGGQGQRVRLGRAFLRRQPRLVLLDEPFRGLTRERRRELLGRAREHWRAATLLFVSHDVEDTSQLDQVIVIDGGRIVERGAPRALLADPSSVYARLTESARALRAELWGAPLWRKLSVRGGRLGESEAVRAPAPGDAS